MEHYFGMEYRNLIPLYSIDSLFWQRYLFTEYLHQMKIYGVAVSMYKAWFYILVPPSLTLYI